MSEHSGVLVIRQDHRSSGTFLLGLAAQLLWLFCCLGAYSVVSRSFQYQGFVIVAPVDVAKLLCVVLALVGLSLLLPYRLANPADYVVVGLFEIAFVPFCTYWLLSNQPWWQWLLTIIYWGVVLLVNRVRVHFPTFYVKGAQNMMFLVARGLVLIGAILIVAGGHLTLRLPLSDVYGVRAIWASEGSWISTYLFPWLAHVLLPVLLVYAWKNRRFGELLLLGFTAYMLFTSTGMKSYLFMPVVTVVVFVIAEWRPLGSIVPIGLGFYTGAMLLLDNITGTIGWSSLGLRRVFFVPAHLTSVYLDFFAAHPVMRLSESVLLRGWLTSPYPTSLEHVIGTVLGEPAMNANNGLVADGFANFGVLGALIWAVLLGVLLLCLRVVTEHHENRPEAWAVAAMWPDILVSCAFATSLLTQGLALGLLVAWSLPPEAPVVEHTDVELKRGAL